MGLANEATQTARLNLFINTKGAEGSMTDLTVKVNKLRAELKLMNEADPAFAGKLKEFQTLNRSLEDMNLKLQGTTRFWKNWGNSIKEALVQVTLLFGFQAVFQGIDNLMQRNAKLSDQFADIRKTTGLTTIAVNRLNKEFSRMDTRTPTSDLRTMAAVAGQLGYDGEKDVLKFVGAMDKLNVALGDEFGNAETITKDLGALRNIFSDIKTQQSDEDLMKIGNAINELSADGAATAPVISDFSNRIGGVGITLGLTSGQVLGLSATLQELNVTAERGGTAVIRILQKMTTETESFAKIAGLSVKEYKNLLNNDLFGAFNLVIKKSQEGGKSTTEFAKMMQDAELKGAGASEVFAKLGNNTQILSQKVDLANQSLKNTDSIMNEFNIKNQNFAAHLEKIQKWFAGLMVSPALVGSMNILLDFFANMVTSYDQVSQSLASEQRQVNALVSELSEANTTAERRNEIYEQLKKIAPDIVAGIDKESISVEKLTTNLKKYNDAMINRIIIQKQQEKIDEQNAKVADLKARKMEQEAELRDLMAKITLRDNPESKKALQIDRDTSLTLEEKAKKIYKTLELTKANGRELTDMNFLTVQYHRTLKALNQEENVGNLLLVEKKKLINQLNGNTDTAIPDQGGGRSRPKAKEDNSVPDDEMKKRQARLKAQDEYDKLMLDMAKRHHQAMLDQMEDGFGKEAVVIAYDFEEKESKRNLQYEEALAKQKQYLDKGIISRRTYNARVADIEKVFGQEKTDLEAAANAKYAQLQKSWYEKDEKEYQAHKQKLADLDAAAIKSEQERQKAIEQYLYSQQVKQRQKKKGGLTASGNYNAEAAIKSREIEITLEEKLLELDQKRAHFKGNNEEQIANEKYLAAETVRVHTEAALELRKIEDQRLAKSKQAMRQSIAAYVDVAKVGINSFFEILQSNNQASQDAQLTALNNRYDLETQALSDKNDRELALLQARYDKENELINQKYENENQQSEDALNQALINAQERIYKDIDLSKLGTNQRSNLEKKLQIEQDKIKKKYELEDTRRKNKQALDDKARAAQQAADEQAIKVQQATEEKALTDKKNAEEREIKLKNWNANRAMSVGQALINGALAITNVWANMVDPTPFQVFKAAGSIAAIATTAAQIAVIAAQPTPAFQQGTEFLDGKPGIDTNLVRLTRGERVVPVGINEQLRGIPNNQLPAMARAYLDSQQYTPDFQAIGNSNVNFAADFEVARKVIPRFVNGTEPVGEKVSVNAAASTTAQRTNGTDDVYTALLDKLDIVADKMDDLKLAIQTAKPVLVLKDFRDVEDTLTQIQTKGRA